MLLLNNDEVQRAIAMEECIEAIEEAFVEEGRGWAMSDSRIDRHAPTDPASAAAALGMSIDEYRTLLLRDRLAKDAFVEPAVFDAPWAHMFKTMYGILHKRGVGALRASSETMAMPTINGARRIAKLPTGPGGRYTSLILLFDTRAGHLTCIMPDGYIQRNRVVATGAVGTKHLARPDAGKVGLLGSGMMADGSVEAALAVLKKPSFKVFSPSSEHRKALARRWAERGVDITDVSSADEAMRDVDIIIGATNSAEPVIRSSHLKPGMHVNCTTFFEIERQAVEKSDRVAASWRMVDAGGWDWKEYELPAARSEARLLESSGTWLRDFLRNPDLPTLGDVLTGKASGRTSAAEITCHMNTSGGVQFAALGARILANARQKGLGRELPDDWFLEELHP